MKRVLPTLFVLAAVLLPPAVGSPAQTSSAQAERVLVLLIDRVSLAELVGADTPSLDGLIEDGAVGLLTMPVVGVRGGADAYATVGAGGATDVGPTGDLAFGLNEQIAGGTGHRLWAALTGREAADENVVVPYGAHMHARAEAERPRALIGLLGDALHGAGLLTAVVGNADAPEAVVRPLGVQPETEPLPPGIETADLTLHRPAALLVMDRLGLVDRGAVSPDLAAEDPSAPGGLRANRKALVQAVEAALEDAAVVVVDPGDLARADLADAGEVDRRLAIEDADLLLRKLLGLVDPETTLVIVGGLAPSVQMVEEHRTLTPLVVAGPGVERGFLTSPSTRVAGLVSGTDLGPTILDALGVAVPRAMRGRPIEVRASSEDDRIERLLTDEDEAGEHEATRGGVLLLLQLGGLAAVLAALTAGARLAIAVSSLPLWMLLTPGADFVLALIVPALLAALLWWLAGMERRPGRLLAVVWGAAALVVLADLAFGASLQRASALGPEVATGERLSWLGDPAIGLLAGAWLVGPALIRRWSRSRAALAVGMPALALYLGLVGQSLSAVLVVAAGGLALGWLLPGRPLRIWAVLLAAVGGLALAAAVAYTDYLRDDPTQASTIIRSVQAFGFGEAAGILRERAAHAAATALTSLWTLVAAGAVYAAWDAWPFLGSGTRRVLAGTAVGGLLALLLTDGGVDIAGMMAVLAASTVAVEVWTGAPGAPGRMEFANGLPGDATPPASGRRLLRRAGG